ncbi:MAG: hypothetical protein WD076_04780, partial [Parvularculaceae bacterium]
MTLMAGLSAYQFGSLTTMRGSSHEILEKDFFAFELIATIRQSELQMAAHRESAVALHFLKSADLVDATSRVAQQDWESARQRTAEGINKLLVLAKERVESSRISENAELWRGLVNNAEASETKLAQIGEAVNAQFELLNSNQLAELQSQLEIVQGLRVDFDDQMGQLDNGAGSIVVAAQRAIDAIYL